MVPDRRNGREPFRTHSRFARSRSEGEFVIVAGNGDFFADLSGLHRFGFRSGFAGVLLLGADEMPVQDANVDRGAGGAVPIRILADGQVPDDLERLTRFRDNPSDESWIGGVQA